MRIYLATKIYLNVENLPDYFTIAITFLKFFGSAKTKMQQKYVV